MKNLKIKNFGKKFVAIAFVAVSIFLSLNLILKNFNYENAEIENEVNTCSSVIDTNKLKELSKKYVANEEIEEDNTVPGNYSLDYTNFTNKEYYSSTTFNRINYFENLLDFSPYNSVGSCGFVSLIQAMSYYDTFYNYDIIPEKYNCFNQTATSEIEAKLYSPGVLRQAYDSSKYTSYYEYCNATKDKDFQSYLTVLYNEWNKTNNDGTHVDDSGNIVNNFVETIGAWDYQVVLNKLYGDTNSVKVNDYRKLSQEQYTNLIKESISSGNPAIVHIRKYDSYGKAYGEHSVVAYDFGASGIYANFGWYGSANRYPLLGGPANYTEIYRVATLDFSHMQHWHSRNYVINSQPYCGCNLNDDLNFEVKNRWSNVPPTIYWMKDINTPDETFSIEFKSVTFGDVYCSFTTDRNQITLSVNDWRNIIKASNKNKGCYAEFKRLSSKSNFMYTLTEIRDTSSSFYKMEHITLSPAEYGYSQAYNESEISANIMQGDYTIATQRLRCGYIEHEGIVLSPRKEGEGTAFLNYSLEYYVYRIDVDLSLWSENEYLSSTDSTVCIQYKNSSGIWVTAVDLLNDVELSTDRLFPETYTVMFPEKTKEFRIYSSTRTIGNHNKGRLCIGDISIYLEGK